MTKNQNTERQLPERVTNISIRRNQNYTNKRRRFYLQPKPVSNTKNILKSLGMSLEDGESKQIEQMCVLCQKSSYILEITSNAKTRVHQIF